MTRDDLLAAYAHGCRDFRGTNLREANLSGAHLAEADLRTADLRRADLRGADLAGVNLRMARLSRADLRGADLAEDDLRRADLRGAYLCRAYLCGADLRRANLRRANLAGARLSEADLRGADLSMVLLSEAAWGATRLHDTGTWSAAPPRCSVGDWCGWVIAPGVVRIGRTTMSVSEWLADGPRLAAAPTPLRQWLRRLDAQTEWPGWVPDAERDHDA